MVGKWTLRVLIVIFVFDFVAAAAAVDRCARLTTGRAPRKIRASGIPGKRGPAESLAESLLLFLMPGRIPRRGGDEIKRRECRVSKLARIYGALCNTAFLNSAI